MVHTLRQQNDGLGDEVSKATRLDASHPVLVRAEFGPDTDIRTILRRHGATVGTQFNRKGAEPVYGTETNFDKDLTTALADIKRAHEAFEALPKKYRDKFKTADELWRRNKHNFEVDNDDEQNYPLGEPSTGEPNGHVRDHEHRPPQGTEATRGGPPPQGRATGANPPTDQK